jgi:hypothetical protein
MNKYFRVNLRFNTNKINFSKMKNSIKLVALAAMVSFGAVSCTKLHHREKNHEDEIKNITLEVALKQGETYSLDLAQYGDADDVATITKEALNVAGSKLAASTNPFAGAYSYTADASYASDQVVLQVNEGTSSDCHNGNSGIAAGGCQNGGGNHHEGNKEHHVEQTNITINFVVANTTSGKLSQAVLGTEAK